MKTRVASRFSRDRWLVIQRMLTAISGLSEKLGSRGGEATLSLKLCEMVSRGGDCFSGSLDSALCCARFTLSLGAAWRGDSSFLAGWKNLRIPPGSLFTSTSGSLSDCTGERDEREESSEESSWSMVRSGVCWGYARCYESKLKWLKLFTTAQKGVATRSWNVARVEKVEKIDSGRVRVWLCLKAKVGWMEIGGKSKVGKGCLMHHILVKFRRARTT